MPYNTRRKSLSLPSLGIHLPNASRSHRSPSASSSSKGAGAATTDEQIPPSKKVKRSHDPIDANKSTSQSQPHLARAALEHTPPPSPGDVAAIPKIDVDGINDDVVVAAIRQLEKTGNKPHLVRELAAVLVNVNETVANSANPAALLSSRLSSYMKRSSWTALSPCPVGKELINVHPRKVFYYLTTYPHQPLPNNLDEMIAVDAKQMTPSLSSASVDQDDDDEEAMARERSRLSPSPEIDLSPEYEEEQHDLNGQESTSGFSDQRAHRLSHNHRSASPPLEGDEREFTQTASSVRERASEEKASRQGSLDVASASPSDESQDHAEPFPISPMDEDPMNSMSEEDGRYFAHAASRDQDNEMEDETVAALFGTSPSPSLSSMASSMSSGTTVSSEAGSTADGLQSLQENIMDSARGATPASGVDGGGGDIAAVPSSLKRPFDLIETGLPIKSDMQPKQLRTFDFDMVIDSWNDLRSPETVEVDELDEMFGDI